MNIIKLLPTIKKYLYEGVPFMWDIWHCPIQMISFVDKQGYNGGCGSVWFDSTGKVLHLTVEVDINGKSYCYAWNDNEFRKVYFSHAKSKKQNPYIAWDNVRYTFIKSQKQMLSIITDVIEVDYIRLPVIEIK